ncbi:MAG TPA: hypothetical protein VFG29_14075 [Syntrophales bacterium]|nr:hypothetical protein [Syntrophales bacterium]
MNTRRNSIVLPSSKGGSSEIKNRLVSSFFSRGKASLVILCLLAIPQIGFCDEVVYRISPDSAAKMTVQEARDAVALALSRRAAGLEAVERVYLDGDDFVAFVRLTGRDVPGKITTSYDLIGQKIIKEGNIYKIPVKPGSFDFGFSTNGDGDYIMNRSYVFRWESEKDAKLFLDAVNVLRQNKYGGKKQ